MGARCVGIHPSGQQEPDPLLERGFSGVLQGFGGDLGGRLVLVAEQAMPRTAITPSQPEVEEELEEGRVIAGDVAGTTVVDGLAVVGLGACLEEQAGEDELPVDPRGTSRAPKVSLHTFGGHRGRIVGEVRWSSRRVPHRCGGCRTRCPQGR